MPAIVAVSRLAVRRLPRGTAAGRIPAAPLIMAVRRRADSPPGTAPAPTLDRAAARSHQGAKLRRLKQPRARSRTRGASKALAETHLRGAGGVRGIRAPDPVRLPAAGRTLGADSRVLQGIRAPAADRTRTTTPPRAGRTAAAGDSSLPASGTPRRRTPIPKA